MYQKGKFAITCKDDAFVAKTVIRRLPKKVVATFALAERLPTTATLHMSIENEPVLLLSGNIVTSGHTYSRFMGVGIEFSHQGGEPRG